MTTTQQPDPGAAPESVAGLRVRQTVLDSTDHRAHAEFYRRLLGADYAPGSEPGQEQEPQYIELQGAQPGGALAFQTSENHQAPDWPEHRHVPTQAHIDIDVPAGHLDQAVEHAVWLGARVLSTAERDQGAVVLADPAGHPFCFLDVG